MTNVIGADLDLAYPNLTDGKSFGLGDRYTDHSGNVFVYCQASGAITQDDIAILDEDWTAVRASTTTSASARGQKCGAAQATLADDEYGWFQVYGTADFRVKSSCAVNAVLNTTASAGVLDDDSTTGAEVIDGIVLTTAGAAGSTSSKEGILNFPTVGATEA